MKAFYTLILLTILSSCNNAVKPDVETQFNLNDSTFFKYDAIINNEYRFIEFKRNQVIWGTKLKTFSNPYDGSMDIDNLEPTNFTFGYNVHFMEKEIKVEGPAKYLYFNFENNNISHGLIHSLGVFPEITKYKNFEVAYLDYEISFLQRVFIAIDKEKVNDTVMIQSIVCQIKELYDISDKTCISFFSDIKYADYKEQLFFDENNSLLIGKEEAYENWMDYHYLGEFEFESMMYSTFPACGTDYKRKKQVNINCNYPPSTYKSFT